MRSIVGVGEVTGVGALGRAPPDSVPQGSTWSVPLVESRYTMSPTAPGLGHGEVAKGAGAPPAGRVSLAPAAEVSRIVLATESTVGTSWGEAGTAGAASRIGPGDA